MNSWQQHVLAWGSCKLCPLWKTRNQVVLARGEIPASIFFCGEAPGEAEDTFGVPFCGPAGHELDSWIAEATVPFPVKPSMAYGNLLACIPKDANGSKVHEPEPDCVDSCRPRLLELVSMVQPKLIVAVGAVAKSWTDPSYSGNIVFRHTDGSFISRVSIDHPARILRTHDSTRNLLRQKAIATLRLAIESISVF